MPLVLLGLIVVVGGCLLIYYQFGPAISRRLGTGGGGYADGFRRSPEGRARYGSAGGEAADGGSEPDEKLYETSADGKVLFVFGGGEREERPLNAHGGAKAAGNGEDDAAAEPGQDDGA
ncbi:MAG: hypothetical protein LBS91_06880 [Clostridiales Family XIII bacterium]|jgi:hypothetical protein|nr:hypothetical protein [Clostridiales Family XIII bacterium]